MRFTRAHFESTLPKLIRLVEAETRTRGGRFLYMPERNLANFNGLMFFGLNPGGHADDASDAIEKYEASDFLTDYHHDAWTTSGPSPLQQQIRLLFAALFRMKRGEDFLNEKFDEGRVTRLESSPAYRSFVRGIICGNVVPFRSPSWDAFPVPFAKIQDLIIAEYWDPLMAEIGGKSRVRGVVTMGELPFRFMQTYFGVTVETRFEPIAWGKVRGRFVTPANGPVIVGLPHLSTFKVFGRPESTAPLGKLLRLLV